MSSAGLGSDRGAQNERTALAWRRSILSFAGLGLVDARVALQDNFRIAIVITTGTLAIVGILLIAHHRRYRANQVAIGDGRVRTDGALPALTAAAVVALGLAGIEVVLLK